MLTHNLGYPRIGANRELKKACESYWAGKTSKQQLLETGKSLRSQNWLLQQKAGISLIPSNDFSFYDHVLDTSFLLGVIPERYERLAGLLSRQDPDFMLDLYFAMARGIQKEDLDVHAMEMTKWFDTNYHYIVPEFVKEQRFRLLSSKVFDEFKEARDAGIVTKPVLIGPVSYLLLGKEKEEGFHRLDLIRKLVPVYAEIVTRLQDMGAEWIQFDEPCMTADADLLTWEAYRYAYSELSKYFQRSRLMLATYFEGIEDRLDLALKLPVHAIHIDLVRKPEQLYDVMNALPDQMILSLGVVDGRNIWRNDMKVSLDLINRAISKLKRDRLMIAPSCSLIHVPCDMEAETDEVSLPGAIRKWMAFAKQKLDEVVLLGNLLKEKPYDEHQRLYRFNQAALEDRKTCPLLQKPEVRERMAAVREEDYSRKSPFMVRKQLQHQALKLPVFPTTTIGSFPQTADIRSLRAKLKSGVLPVAEYNDKIRTEIQKAIRWQEEIGIDVLVHGEFERNDMVEYFGEQLEGFAFTRNGWVQSYGSRCVKPPVIYGDVSRPHPMTVEWTSYAQSLTSKKVKGMLTGPVTILQWSFVRNDQPRSQTTHQIALAIRDEVRDLEAAGINIIQIDEPALREGLPLRKKDWEAYLHWAVDCFRLSASPVQDETQIHTHMCYSEFNDIIYSIAAMDADVISIETSRSQMELLSAFHDFQYPNEIGPGVYDIHSPRIPSRKEMIRLLEKAASVIPPDQLWVNPDCGLKTRGWEETKAALVEMIGAAREMRSKVSVESGS